MGKHIRHSKECENCGYTVELIYCSRCGKKNVETRQSFVHLIGHFAEDLTHYDSGFWRTIKYLMFVPSRLTKEYLMGHRQRFVPPVKLYIFISFVTFLLIGILPTGKSADENNGIHIKNKVVNASLEAAVDSPIFDEADVELSDGRAVNSIKELDSVRALPKGPNISTMEYLGAKTLLNAKEHKLTLRGLGEAFVHTLPKVLFLYLPVFAFWLWLFHGKKRWYFFDHGIFTLHYFSFLLLLIAVIHLLGWTTGLFIRENENIIMPIIIIASLYSFFYFFRAHRLMYSEKRWISALKSFALFLINFFSIIVVLLATLLYIFFSIH